MTEIALSVPKERPNPPSIHIRAASVIEDAEILVHQMRMLQFYKENQYKIPLPSWLSSAIHYTPFLSRFADVPMKSKEKRETYKPAVEAMQRYIPFVQAAVSEMQQFKNKWGLELEPAYDVVVTKYSPGGHYDLETRKIFITPSTSALSEPSGRIIHEIAHLGLDKIMREHQLSQDEREALVEAFCMHIQHVEGTSKKSSKRVDKAFFSYLLRLSNWDDLPSAIKEYKGNRILPVPEIHAIKYRLGDTSMWISDSVRNDVHRNYRNVRGAIEADLNELTTSPFGPRSIDPGIKRFDRREQAMRLRTVNRAGPHLQSLFPNIQIAIKGTGQNALPGDTDREDLLQQFETMNELQTAFANAPSDFQGVIRPVEVFGAIDYPVDGLIQRQQWLLMEYVDGKGMGEYNLNGYEHGYRRFGFDKRHHPRLASLIKLYYPEQYNEEGNYISMRLVRKMIEKVTGVCIMDIHGRDILCIGKGENEQYRIIDIKRSEIR